MRRQSVASAFQNMKKAIFAWCCHVGMPSTSRVCLLGFSGVQSRLAPSAVVKSQQQGLGMCPKTSETVNRKCQICPIFALCMDVAEFMCVCVHLLRAFSLEMASAIGVISAKLGSVQSPHS